MYLSTMTELCINLISFLKGELSQAQSCSDFLEDKIIKHHLFSLLINVTPDSFVVGSSWLGGGGALMISVTEIIPSMMESLRHLISCCTPPTNPKLMLISRPQRSCLPDHGPSYTHDLGFDQEKGVWETEREWERVGENGREERENERGERERGRERIWEEMERQKIRENRRVEMMTIDDDGDDDWDDDDDYDYDDEDVGDDCDDVYNHDNVDEEDNFKLLYC